MRNVLVAAGNSGDATLAAPCRHLLGDASPLVRGAAVWALSQLLPATAFQALSAERLPMEKDRGVMAEWNSATDALPASAGAAA